MVAVIHAGKSLREALNYNENKVKNGVATILDAGYYLKDPNELSFNEKLSRLQRLIDLNEAVKVNTLHISLNFSPEESLSESRLKEIAAVYLNKIGFARQPYLLYEHKDVAHQHVHIVTTSIRPDGSRIKLHNIGRNHSELARKQIETEFRLVKAEDHKGRVFELKPVDVQRVNYGRSQTKQAISNVLSIVLRTYKYTSFPELNAVLRQYNVMADRGSEDSRIYKRNGLVYRILDEKGNRVGVPIKASDFHHKPTLAYLQKQFEVNESERLKYKARVKNTVDFFLQKHKEPSLDALGAALSKEGITMILRRSESGQLYGLTYVDHRTKCVFNGSTLGKEYSAKAISGRCEMPGQRAETGKINASTATEKLDEKLASIGENSPVKTPSTWQIETHHQPKDKVLEDLFNPVEDHSLTPWQLRRRRRKGKRRTS